MIFQTDNNKFPPISSFGYCCPAGFGVGSLIMSYLKLSPEHTDALH